MTMDPWILLFLLLFTGAELWIINTMPYGLYAQRVYNPNNLLAGTIAMVTLSLVMFRAIYAASDEFWSRLRH